MDSNIAQKLNDLNSDRVACITNLTQKGVTANNTDGFSQIASKILKIPSDKLTGVYVDNEVAYRKQVPSNSAGFCYLNSIGGMTYKGFTFDCTVVEDGGFLFAPYSFTFPKEFSLPDDAEGYWEFAPVVVGFPNGLFYDTPSEYTLSGKNMSGAGYGVTGVTVGTQLRCIPRFVDNMAIEPRYFYPPDCFTDLRDAKPTAVVSYGNNVLDFEAALHYWNAGYTKDGEKYTITDFGNGYSHPYVFTDKAEICTLSASESFAHIVTGVRINLGYYDGTEFTESGALDIGKSATTSAIAVNALRLNYSSASSAGWYFSYSEIRINLGTTDLPYTPYRKPITYDLPEAITNTLGKGCSDTIFDEYSFVDQKAITRVGSGEFKSAILDTDTFPDVRMCFRHPFVEGMITETTSSVAFPVKMPFFDDDVSISKINANPNLVYKVGRYNRNVYFYVPKAVSPDVASFNAWEAKYPSEFVAELATAFYTETSIPTDFDGLIEVEAGGYLEFVNQYGYPVPSTVTFSLINGGGTT